MKFAKAMQRNVLQTCRQWHSTQGAQIAAAQASTGSEAPGRRVVSHEDGGPS